MEGGGGGERRGEVGRSERNYLPVHSISKKSFNTHSNRKFHLKAALPLDCLSHT